MKRKVLLGLSVLTLGIAGVNGNATEVSAYEPGEAKDYSYLLTEDAIVGGMQIQTMGIYLSDGMAVIREAGTGKVAAGGITTAAQPCNVSINVIVERLSDNHWVTVTTWTSSLPNTWSVATSKVLSVGKGYYYRTRCVHYAKTDVSSSWTDGLWR